MAGHAARPGAERTSVSRRGLLTTGASAIAAVASGVAAGVVTAVAAGDGAGSDATGRPDLGYLEHLGKAGVLPESMPYLSPGALHSAYSHAIYVNTAPRGIGAQKMWVIARSGGGADGDGWQLALWDGDYWRGQPAEYSWPVSTGRRGPGNPPYVLTPVGIFNIDERSGRNHPGWGSPGMYSPVYIDLHYFSGRISAVALHGTTRSMYPLLGERASHGCVRMTQANADLLWEMIHPGGARGPGSALWGEVPRFFRSVPRDNLAARTGYVRDGSQLYDSNGTLLTRMGYRVICVFFRDDGESD